jgi:hypothetical protein
MLGLQVHFVQHFPALPASVVTKHAIFGTAPGRNEQAFSSHPGAIDLRQFRL